MGWLKNRIRHRRRGPDDPVFDAQARDYRRKRSMLGLSSPARFGEALTTALEGYDRAGRALDVGAGTGLLTREIAPHCDEVVLVDVSPGMLEVAREQLADLRHVVYAEGDFFAGAGGDGPFDLVVFTDVLHHTGRHAEAVAEAARRLAPGGLLVIMEYQPGPLRTRLAVAVEELFLEDIQLVDSASLCALCAAQGIDGEATMISSWEYLYVGRRRAAGGSPAAPTVAEVTP